MVKADDAPASQRPVAIFIYASWIGFGIGFLVSFWMNRVTDQVAQIAWPFAAIVIGILIRPHAISLLYRLESFEARGFKAKFRQEFSQFEDSLRSSSSLVGGATPDSGAQSKEELALKRLAAELPAAAIMESWIRVEETLQDLAISRDRTDLIRRGSISPIISWVQSEKILSDDAVNILRHLRNLRNISVHASGSERDAITYDQAAEAINAALQIVAVIRGKMSSVREAPAS